MRVVGPIFIEIVFHGLTDRVIEIVNHGSTYVCTYAQSSNFRSRLWLSLNVIHLRWVAWCRTPFYPFMAPYTSFSPDFIDFIAHIPLYLGGQRLVGSSYAVLAPGNYHHAQGFRVMYLYITEGHASFLVCGAPLITAFWLLSMHRWPEESLNFRIIPSAQYFPQQPPHCRRAASVLISTRIFGEPIGGQALKTRLFSINFCTEWTVLPITVVHFRH